MKKLGGRACETLNLQEVFKSKRKKELCKLFHDKTNIVASSGYCGLFSLSLSLSPSQQPVFLGLVLNDQHALAKELSKVESPVKTTPQPTKNPVMPETNRSLTVFAQTGAQAVHF